MSANSGDYCSFGKKPVPAHMITHYRCDDHADGTVTDARTGEIVTRAPIGSPRGFNTPRPSNTPGPR